MSSISDVLFEKSKASLHEDPMNQHWAPPGLKENVDLLSQDELALGLMLVAEGQEHLFASWPPAGIEDKDKHRFFRQVAKLDGNYPGGLSAYIRNARQLLVNARDGVNPFSGYAPTVPTGERLFFGDGTFEAMEARGLGEMYNAAFVLVAGGLGERLGFSGIKVALPSQTTTGQSFLSLYIENILALQATANARSPARPPRQVPFVIMTSDDTHDRTEALLKTNSYFGMQPSQVHLLKQEKVACLADSTPALALDPSDPYSLQTKPHGHGDVHSLLHSSGILSDWLAAELKWVLFFQDTNGLLFKAIPASLGVSSSRGLDVNSLAVPRKAKESIGAIARLTHTDGREMVVNVEYNQLDPLLRATCQPEGDVNDESGFSPYPGNINQLVLKLEPYAAELARTNGLITEFVNPKYKDASRTAFKSSTRLECMMQDYPKTLPPTASIGFTVVDVWLGYSPVKNSTADALVKLASGTPPHSATQGEMDIYAANARIFRQAGVEVDGPTATQFAEQQVELWPRIVWSPFWGVTFADISKNLQGKCRISRRSTLVLRGANIVLKDLDLDGTLIIDAPPGANVMVDGLIVHNKGWELTPVDFTDISVPEEVRMRGFRIVKQEERHISIAEDGDHVVSC